MFMERLGNTWYLVVLGIVLILIYLFKSIFFDLIGKCCGEDKNHVPTSIIENNEAGKIRSQRSLTTSYKLENNPDYFEILAIMNPQAIASRINPP